MIALTTADLKEKGVPKNKRAIRAGFALSQICISVLDLADVADGWDGSDRADGADGARMETTMAAVCPPSVAELLRRTGRQPLRIPKRGVMGGMGRMGSLHDWNQGKV